MILLLVVFASISGSDLGTSYLPYSRGDLTTSRVRKWDLESTVTKLSRGTDVIVIDHSLTWTGLRPSWRLKFYSTFRYSFFDRNGKRLSTEEDAVFLDDGFLSGNLAAWERRVQISCPPQSVFLSIEFVGTGLITHPVPIPRP